jgi:hypothetical protein
VTVIPAERLPLVKLTVRCPASSVVTCTGWSGWASLGQPEATATTTVADVVELPRAAAAADVSAA